MPSRLQASFATAARLATTSLEEVAEGLGRGSSTLYAYLSGGRRVTPAAAQALAAYLRERARAFNKAAEQLDAAADREERRSQ